MNVSVRRYNDGFHWHQNEDREAILEYVLAYHIVLANTYFKTGNALNNF